MSQEMKLEVGAPAPLFTALSDAGEVSLTAYRGRPVVLYFYPKDNTPGCTTEACDFRDREARLIQRGAVVLGVSRDSLKSHASFKEKYELGFPLITDPEAALHKAYGAWGEKTSYGKTTVGPIRSTFLIDGEGVLRRAWRSVKVAGHVDQVLAALDSLDSGEEPR